MSIELLIFGTEIKTMPHYTTQVPLQDYTPEQFLAITIKACDEMYWDIIAVSDTGLVAKTEGSSFEGAELITITIEQSNASITSDSGKDSFVDRGNKDNVTILLKKINQLKAQTSSEDLSKLVEKMKEDLVTVEDDVVNGKSIKPKRQKKWWTSLMPTKEFFVVPLLIYVNVFLFLLMVIFSGDIGAILLPSTNDLISWGANLKPRTMSGEWWRLFTCMFCHIGIIHLAMNMFALLFGGLFLERMVGPLRFSVAYFSSGLFASLTSLWWHDNVVSAGASGAIFGIYGVFLALLSTRLIEKQVRNAMLKNILIFVVYSLVYGLRSGIDNAAHVGGLLSGIVIGFLLYLDMTRLTSKPVRSFMMILIIALPILASILMVPKIKNPYGDYDKVVTKFQEYEQIALSAYRQDTPIDNKVYLADLINDGIPNWEKAINELKTLDALDLPTELIPYRQTLQQYATLRYEEAVMHKEKLAGEKNHSESSFSEIENKIERLVRSLDNSK